MKYCISQLFESFLRHYYAFIHDKKIEDSTYDFHFEAIIEFIENIGDTYDSVDEKERNDRPTYYEEAKAHVLAILNITSPPNKEKLELLENLSPDEYFKLLDIINADFIKKNFPRLSALLQNLVERRKNKWQKHLSMADGPKKLKDIQDDINKEDEELAGKGKGNTAGNQKEKEREKEKAEQEKLDKKVKELFEGWEMGKNEELREIKDILRKYNERQFYLSFLRQVADEKKDNVSKRVTLFPVLLSNERFSVKDFKNAWIDAIKVSPNLFSSWPSDQETSPSAEPPSQRCCRPCWRRKANWMSTSRSSKTKTRSTSWRKFCRSTTTTRRTRTPSSSSSPRQSAPASSDT